MVLKNLFAGQQWRNRHREETYGHGERAREGEMHGKSNMETYITICKIDGQQEFAVWLRKLKQGLYQPRGPFRDEWVKKLWYVYTMEYYSTIKRNAFESVLMRWIMIQSVSNDTE